MIAANTPKGDRERERFIPNPVLMTENTRSILFLFFRGRCSFLLTIAAIISCGGGNTATIQEENRVVLE
jgi:hypothetical protein